MADSMDRVEQSGEAFFKGPGVKHASTPKRKNGDESVAMAGAMGSSGSSWMQMLDEGAKNPYPSTVEALKTKNTRKNNDTFF